MIKAKEIGNIGVKTSDFSELDRICLTEEQVKELLEEGEFRKRNYAEKLHLNRKLVPIYDSKTKTPTGIIAIRFVASGDCSREIYTCLKPYKVTRWQKD